MKKVSLLLTVIVAVTLMFSNCGKYEEGPAISFRTKTARVANDWVIEKYIVDGEEQDISWFSGYVLTLEKDGTGRYTFKGSSEEIKWEFDSSKEKLGITDADKSFEDDDYETILKLKNDEMWIKDEDGDEVHYKTK